MDWAWYCCSCQRYIYGAKRQIYCIIWFLWYIKVPETIITVCIRSVPGARGVSTYYAWQICWALWHKLFTTLIFVYAYVSFVNRIELTRQGVALFTNDRKEILFWVFRVLFLLFANFSARGRHIGIVWVTTYQRMLWDVSTYPRTRYLLLVM